MPGADLSGSVKQIPEPADIQAFTAKPSMETLNMIVLSRFSRLNMNRRRPVGGTKTDSDDWLAPARSLSEEWRVYRAPNRGLACASSIRRSRTSCHPFGFHTGNSIAEFLIARRHAANSPKTLRPAAALPPFALRAHRRGMDVSEAQELSALSSGPNSG